MLGGDEVSRIHLGPDLVYRSSYYLHAEAGAVALTGKAASQTRTIPHPRGSFTLAGKDAGMAAARKLAAASGSFAFAGQSAEVRQLNRYSAERGLFSLGGQSAGLVASRRLTAAVGSMSLAGQVSAPAILRKLVAQRGSFAAGGQPANLIYGAPAVEMALTDTLLYDPAVSGDIGHHTFLGMDFGPDVAGRRLICIVHYVTAAYTPEIVVATIGGSAATVHVQASGGDFQSYSSGTAIISAAPGGTSGNIYFEISEAGGIQYSSAAVYAVQGLYSTTPVDTASKESDGDLLNVVDLPIDVSAGGLLFVGAYIYRNSSPYEFEMANMGYWAAQDLGANGYRQTFGGCTPIDTDQSNRAVRIVKTGGSGFEPAAVAASFR
ncbi:hypothetical protein J2X35_003202 [Mesorhizobium sp. BE184]|nr:hypothetical protein [Mesorhizobium sp. BE184]